MTTDYDIQASQWSGDKPKHISDWVVRPVVLERIKEISKGKKVLDIGCGTGYFSRKMAPFVGKVIAFEKSEKMLNEAVKAEKENSLGIDYMPGDMLNMNFIESGSIDICVLVFVLPYIHPDNYGKVFSEISRILKPGGKFLIAQSHPLMPYLGPLSEKFKLNTHSYKKSRGDYVEFELPKPDGSKVTVGQYNYTFEDLFKHCLKNDLSYQNIKELEIPSGLPKELNATPGEVPYIFLEGIKR